jgi:hypothetical protein
MPPRETLGKESTIQQTYRKSEPGSHETARVDDKRRLQCCQSRVFAADEEDQSTDYFQLRTSRRKGIKE